MVTRIWLGIEALSGEPGPLDRLAAVVDAAIAGVEQRGGSVVSVAFTGLVDATVLVAIVYRQPAQPTGAGPAQPGPAGNG